MARNNRDIENDQDALLEDEESAEELRERKRNATLEAEYAKWAKSLPKAERKKLENAGLDKPMHNSNGYGSRISKATQTTDPDAKLLAYVARDYYELEPVLGITPLDTILEQEDENLTHSDASEFTKQEIARIKADTVSSLLSYLFKPFNKTIPSPVEVASKVYLLAYSIKPECIDGWSLERIANCWDFTKQCFSKRLIAQDKQLNIHAKTRKGVIAVSKYREGTRQYHAERKAAERAEKRKEYLAAYRKARAAELKAYRAMYWAKNKARINSTRRKKRG